MINFGYYAMKTLHLFLLILIMTFSQAGASEEIKKKTVCLNMIVKNESHVITRSLKTVKPFIDYWVILDTGSTDGTQNVIKEYMKDVPGELHEDPFVNFEYSRNKALDFAKGKADYVFFIDADEELSYAPDYQLPDLEKDYYHITVNNNGNEYVRRMLIKNDLNWRWKGVLHEVVVCDDAKTCDVIKGIKNIYHTDGARSKDPLKYQKDAQILEEAIKKEPNSTRTAFYLAQSYRDAKNHEKALEWYTKRVEMGGWDQEVFWAMLEMARMKHALEMPPEVYIPEFLKAYQFRSSRAEPLYYISHYYRLKEDYLPGYLIAKMAYDIPPPNDILFVRKWMYEYGIPLELSVCAYWIGNYEECKQVSEKMLQNRDLPQHVRECVEKNLWFANQKLNRSAEEKDKNELEQAA